MLLNHCIIFATHCLYHTYFHRCGPESLFFGIPTPTPRPESTLWLIVWRNDCVLNDDLREILNSSNKRCTILYKQSFSCKANCTEVKSTATKLHKSPDETERAWSQSLLQMRDSDSGPQPGLLEAATPHLLRRDEISWWWWWWPRIVTHTRKLLLWKSCIALSLLFYSRYLVAWALTHYIVLPFVASQTAENSSHANSSNQSKNRHLAFLASYLTHGIPPLQLD